MVFPLLPVIPTTVASVNIDANSISETIEIFCFLIVSIKGTVPGIPGLFITKSAFRILPSVCCPSSHSISLCIRTFLYDSFIFPLSETKTSYPLAFPKSAVPTPLSPPTNSLTFPCYLIFNVTIEMIANRIPTIQNRVTILLS